MADNIKTVKVNAPTRTMEEPEAPIVGGSAALLPNAFGGKRKRRTRKVGGADGAPVPVEKGLVQILKVTDTGATMNPAAKQSGGEKTNVPPGPELNTTGAKPVAAPVPQAAGAIKVILKPKANKRTKVLLKKKQLPQPVIVNKKRVGRPASSTRKLVLKSLKHKMKHTRHAINQSKTLPLEQIKKTLIEKKLIKPNSKAPENILRQMYADTVIVSKKML